MKNITKILLVVIVFCILSSAVVSLIGGIELKAINPWLDGKNASDVDKIEIFYRNYGVAPNSQVACYYATDEDVINAVMDYYGSIRVSPVWDITDMALYFGGISRDVVVTYADGREESVSFMNGYYVFGLTLLNTSESDGFAGGGLHKFFRFMANDESYEVYTAGDSPSLVKRSETGASEFGFEIYEGDANIDDATHIIETSYATIYVITDKICYLDIDSNFLTTDDGYYTIYNSSFAEIIR